MGSNGWNNGFAIHGDFSWIGAYLGSGTVKTTFVMQLGPGLNQAEPQAFRRGEAIEVVSKT
jgi:hypothetical protein